jgi:hypothetical protein
MTCRLLIVRSSRGLSASNAWSVRLKPRRCMYSRSSACASRSTASAGPASAAGALEDLSAVSLRFNPTAAEDERFGRAGGFAGSADMKKLDSRE